MLAEGLEIVSSEGAGYLKQHESGLATALIPDIQLGTEGFSVTYSLPFKSLRSQATTSMIPRQPVSRYQGLWSSSFFAQQLNSMSTASWLALGVACAAGLTATVLIMRSKRGAS
jgi:hypothetical protein